MKSILFAIFILLFCISCEESKCLNKRDFSVNFKVFIKEHGEKVKDLSDKEKEEYNEQFSDFVENCYKIHKPQMSLRERQYFWKDAVLFLARNNSKADGDFFKFTGENNDLSPYIQSEFEQVLKESGDQFGNNLKEILSEELPKLIDEVVDEVEKIGEELKEALQNKE